MTPGKVIAAIKKNMTGELATFFFSLLRRMVPEWRDLTDEQLLAKAEERERLRGDGRN